MQAGIKIRRLFLSYFQVAHFLPWDIVVSAINSSKYGTKRLSLASILKCKIFYYISLIFINPIRNFIGREHIKCRLIFASNITHRHHFSKCISCAR